MERENSWLAEVTKLLLLSILCTYVEVGYVKQLVELKFISGALVYIYACITSLNNVCAMYFNIKLYLMLWSVFYTA